MIAALFLHLENLVLLYRRKRWQLTLTMKVLHGHLRLGVTIQSRKHASIHIVELSAGALCGRRKGACSPGATELLDWWRAKKLRR